MREVNRYIAAVALLLPLIAHAQVAQPSGGGASFEDSSGLADLLDDETGSGAACFATSPTFTTSIQSNDADPADSEFIRLGNAQCLAWESSPTGTDNTLCVDSSEALVYNGSSLAADGARLRCTGEIQLTEALLTGTSAGDFGHAGGIEVVAATVGKRVVFDHALVRFTFADAAYTACTGGNVKYYNGASPVNASEILSGVFSSSQTITHISTHIDSADAATTALTSLEPGNSLILSGTACTNGASANGTATIDVCYRLLD